VPNYAKTTKKIWSILKKPKKAPAKKEVAKKPKKSPAKEEETKPENS